MPKPLARDCAVESVLVTGAGGFFGQHLLRSLVDQGCRVVAVTRSLSDLRISDSIREPVEWVEIDWADGSAVTDLLARTRPSVIFHLAGARIADGEPKADERNYRGNVAVTKALLRAANLVKPVRIVAVGSAEEYGVWQGPLHEDLAVKPVTSYGKAKAEATRLLLDQTNTLPVVVLRPFSAYGPMQPQRMFIAQAAEHAVANRPFAMTEGKQRRDLIFIDDVVRALLAAAGEPNAIGKVFNIACGDPRPLREVAETIWRLSGTDAPLQIGARPAPPEELHDTWADISRARECLKWEPTVDLESGLRATIEWERSKTA